MTVCVAGPAVTAGVPEIIPVVVSKLRPSGSPGETEYDTTPPPAWTG